MEIRILGRDLEVSEIGFGCMGMSHAYGYTENWFDAFDNFLTAVFANE